MTATLVIHPGALGDVLQAVPALRALRSAGPLTFAGQSRFGTLLRGLGLVDAGLSFDGLGLSALFTDEPLPARLRERIGCFERVVSWFGAGDASYRDRLGAAVPGAVIASPVPDDDSSTPVWRYLLGTIDAAAPVDLAPVPVPAAWREEAVRALRDLGLHPGLPILVAHPGAGGAWKRWPVEHLAHTIQQVCREAGAQVLIHRGPADHEAAGQLARALGRAAPSIEEPDLPLLSGVLCQASAYLGGDSGVSHLAAAVGAPALIAFTSAMRDRWIPWSPTAAAVVLEREPGRADAIAAAAIAAIRAFQGSQA